MTLRQKMAEFFYVHSTVLSVHMKKGVPFVEIYKTLISTKLTRREKKDYIYGLKNPFGADKKDEWNNFQDNIWERLQGDRGFVNTKLYNTEYGNKYQKLKKEEEE